MQRTDNVIDLKKHGRRVNKEVYDEMFAAYTQKQSRRHVAAACGVSPDTAGRAIEKGYPSRGWPALKDRLVEIHARAMEEEDYSLVEAHREMLRAVRQYRGSGWQYVSDKALILQVSPTRLYLVELAIRCRGLNSARGIATTTTGTELTTLDSVLAPGSGMGGMGCPIRHIYKVQKLVAPE